ncbi:MAG: hypothetical protein QQW96_12615 [Tychonema bourrellyi B0820]|nr:hypothetical protein [Tychonema bourrellyi B0820]
MLILGGLEAHPTGTLIFVEQASSLLLILGGLEAHPTQNIDVCGTGF